jgi:hypothetical protein
MSTTQPTSHVKDGCVLGTKDFFSQFCDKVQSGNHLENNLIKFGCILDMKK